MKKRMICLLLALVLFAGLPVMGARAFADGEYKEYIVGSETMKIICEKNGLDYDFCKNAIIKLNAEFSSEEDFSSKLTFGMTIKLPKSNGDAAKILGVALPASVPSSTTVTATGSYIEYTVKDDDTVIGICKKLGLDFATCKAAIMKLNNFASDYSFLTLKTGNVLKMPKTDADAKKIISAAATTTTTTTTAATATAAAAAALTGADYVAAYLVPHVVKAGETLYGICVENGIDYSRYSDLIVKASSIKSADWLHSGDVLYIPSSTAATGGYSVVAHTVKAGETTYGICQGYGTNYGDTADIIAALNPGKNLSSIRQGQLMFFPSGVTAAKTTTAAAATTNSAYTPVAATVSTFTPKTGVNFYLKEITVAKDDTIYNLVKAAGFEYTTYYSDVLLAANKLGSFNNLKAGDKLLMLSSSATGAKYAITGVTVKDNDMTITICDANKVDYGANLNLLTALNPKLNLSNIRTGDIMLLPIKQ